MPARSNLLLIRPNGLLIKQYQRRDQIGHFYANAGRQALPIRLGEDVGAELDLVGAIDRAWHLARGDFEGGSFMDAGP